MDFLRFSGYIVVGLALAFACAGKAAAQSNAPYTYRQVTQQQCDNNTAFWSLWQSLETPASRAAATPPPAPKKNTITFAINGKIVAVFPQSNMAWATVQIGPPPSPPLFPLDKILAALQAVPLSQSLPDPTNLDPGEEYFSPNKSDYVQNYYYDPGQNYLGFGEGYWLESSLYASAANDYEQGNFAQSIPEFDAIVNGSDANDYRAAADYSAARAAFKIGDFADGATRISKLLADPSLAQFWPQAWNLIDRTRAGGDIAPLAAAELLQESALMQQPSASLCDNQPLQQLGLMAVEGMSPAKGMPFDIDADQYGWGGDGRFVLPGIDYAKVHDPVVAAALSMYQSAGTDRKNWQATQNPLWALSLGVDGGIQDIPTLKNAIADVRDSDNWSSLTDRTRAGLVWVLAMDEAQILLKAGQQTLALAALSIPTPAEKAAFNLTDPSGNIEGKVSVPPDWVDQASDMAVNGGAQFLLLQAAIAIDHHHGIDLDQQPQWQAARQWAIEASTALRRPVADVLKPLLVENMDELYLNPVLHLTPHSLDGEISLTPYRSIYDDWTSAQLIAYSRRPFVAPADRQAMVGAAWIRVFAFRDWHDVFAWLPDVRSAFPQLALDTDRINQAWLPATKRHLALLLALKVPGFVAQPSDGRGIGIPADAGWGVNVTANDVFAFDDWNPSDGNWWCPADTNSLDYAAMVAAYSFGAPSFGAPAPLAQIINDLGSYDCTSSGDPCANFNAGVLGLLPYAPIARLGDGGAELAAVRATGSSTQRMAEDAVAWGKNSTWLERATGGDEYLPETLHLAVRATRYGCRRPANNGIWSRAAFAVLHDRYPRSIWAQETPYWFGDMTRNPGGGN